ncbi:MAG: hypothetical protein H0T45_09000 [Pyrinomonadaceae bacterium]|nr:hypothetical protein [Pyrinomonadaceae bacterium]
MFKSKDRRQLDELLDRMGREVLRAASSHSGEAEAENIASSPFLYARVRASINAEQERRAAAGDSWLSLLLVARRAVPAMALSAALAFSMFWFGGGNALTQPTLDNEDLFAANEARIESIVFDERDALTNDEMFDSIISGVEPEAPK